MGQIKTAVVFYIYLIFLFTVIIKPLMNESSSCIIRLMQVSLVSHTKCTENEPKCTQLDKKNRFFCEITNILCINTERSRCVLILCASRIFLQLAVH